MLSLKLLLFNLIFVISISTASQACPEQCRCHDDTVDCSYGNLTSFPANIPPTTVVLLLHHNRISKFDKSYFEVGSALHRLQVLDLRHNELTVIEEYTFESLYYLRELRLDYNNIEFHSDDILDPFTGTEDNLEILTLSHNKLSGVVTEYTYAYHLDLKELDLSYNLFTEVDREAIPRNVQRLDLSYNQLTDIYARSFRLLRRLEYLDLRGVAMSEMQITIFRGLESLKELRISGDKLVTLAQSLFKGLESLEKLEISGSLIERFPVNLLEPCTQLKWLNLTNNRLASLTQPFFSYVPLLQKLDLSQNLIEDADALATALETPRIVKLNLASNLIRGPLTGLVSMEDLEEADLSRNRLTSLDESYSSGSLKQINFAFNLISYVTPDAFSDCIELQNVNLTANQLSKFPTMSTPSKLMTVYVDDNAWHCDCDFVQSYQEYLSTEILSKLSCSDGDLECIRCSTPDELKDVPVKHLDTTRELNGSCNAIKGRSPRAVETVSVQVITGTAVAVMAVVLVIVAVLLWLRRGTVKKFLRKQSGDNTPQRHVSHIYNGIEGGENEYGTIEAEGPGSSTYTLASELNNNNQYEMASPSNATAVAAYATASNVDSSNVAIYCEAGEAGTGSPFQPGKEHPKPASNMYQDPRSPPLAAHYELPMQNRISTIDPYILPEVLPDSSSSYLGENPYLSPAVPGSGYMEFDAGLKSDDNN
ncbi:uncharacterized protein LOC143461209 [Clavelina lepadiformis]|uniref:uncharacterized protein LOC143461209 n=1 Tax=Clavelina lepadiformis TaxID=159417 RepID=UPI004041AE65